MDKEYCMQPICCYDSSSNNALATAIASLNNRRDDHPLAEAALMGNMGNQQWNNPSICYPRSLVYNLYWQ